ncbi:MAG: flippase [bacterium]|nr:flippase [bacterium]
MSLKRAIAHNSIAQIVGKGISTVLGVAAVMIMTRALGTEQFGWYATAAGAMQFAGILTDFGFTVVASSMLSEPRFNKTDLFNSFFTWRVITAVVAHLGTPIVVWLLPYSLEVKLAASALSLCFISIYIGQIFTAYYQVKLKMHIQMISEVLGRIILVAGAAVVAGKNWGFMPMVWLFTISSIASLWYLWYKSEPVKFYFNREITTAIFTKMWPVALSVIFNAFYLQGDRVILPWFVSQTEMGIYSASVRVVENIFPIPALLMGMMLPLITHSWSRGNNAEFRKRVEWSFNLVNLCFIPFTVGAIVLSYPLVMFLFGAKFTGSAMYLSIVAWKMLGISFGLVFSHILLAMNQQKKYLWIFASNAVLSVAGFLYFIPKFGAIGAAYVSLFSEFYCGITMFVVCCMNTRFVPNFTSFVKICLSSLAMGAFIYYIQPFNFVLSVLLGAAIYGLLIVLSGVVSRSLIKEILSVKKIGAESPTELVV